MYFPYYTLLLSFFIPSIVCKSPQEIICSAELGCVCMWALRLSNKILFSEGKPPPAQKGPSEPAGAGQVWHGALELTHMDQIQPWWPPRCPGEGPAVQTRHGGSSEHPLSLLTSWLRGLCFCPTIPRLVSHTCSPSKSPWRVLVWNCQLVLQATNPAASHVVQECK